MLMIRRLAFLLLFCTVPLPAGEAPLPLIPRPRSVTPGEGVFRIDSVRWISAPPELIGEARLLASDLSGVCGAKPEVVTVDDTGEESPLRIVLEIGNPELGAEGYRLSVRPDRITVRAPAPSGIFYGGRSLVQLAAFSGRKEIPSVEIDDSPRFRWRGFMLDCSRTFQSLEYLKRTVDLLAFYKLNVLHLHLTDDQGWRLAIDRYPRLTSHGAWFAEKYGGAGGFYTKEEMCELVVYAAARHVTVVPEIEMPGHCLAALAGYPHFSCTGGPFEIYPFFKGPGIVKEIFCAGNDSVFTFLEEVLDEVMDVFPSEFIHVGGDEVPKERWLACPKCRARMSAEGLDSGEELQSWFIRRMERYLSSRGRRLIGWDEILEGGLAPGAAVMSWRGMQGGAEAAAMGHDVVMSPTSHCYLDYTQERIPVRRAWSFDPVPPGLSPDRQQHVLGLQGNMWTHIATTEPETDSQVWPRQTALAEAAWSKAERGEWEEFRERLLPHIPYLKALGVNCFEGDWEF